MRLTEFVHSRRDALAVGSGRDAAAVAVRDFVAKTGEGFVNAYTQPYNRRWSNSGRRLMRERSRLARYVEDWRAIKENPIVDRSLKALAEDSTSQPFDIKCAHSRAKDEAWRVLERTKYMYQRGGYMRRINGVGDLFLFCDTDFSPTKKRNVGEIQSLRIGPEYTMYRMANEHGVFPNISQAYMQLPDAEISYPISGGENGLELLLGDRFVASPGLNGLLGFGVDGQSSRKIYLHALQVIHGRLTPDWQPVQNGYGVSAQHSSHVTEEVCSMSLVDMALGRKLSTMNRLVHELPETTSQADFEAYDAKVQRMEVTPFMQYVIRGGKIAAVDAQNKQLVEIGDLHLHIDILELALGYPLALVGFRADRVTGELVERMEQRLKAAIAFQHFVEEYEILRPLIDRQFLYSGLAGIQYDILWPEVRLEDSNKKMKRISSAVQDQFLSRETGSRMAFGEQIDDWDAEFARIEKETKVLGKAEQTARGGQNVNKGGKGEEKKDTSEVDIKDTEGTSDEE